MLEIWKTLTGTGGLLRVRAMLVISMTVGGIAYTLGYHEMPPTDYNALWLLAFGWYFISRGNGQ